MKLKLNSKYLLKLNYKFSLKIFKVVPKKSLNNKKKKYIIDL